MTRLFPESEVIYNNNQDRWGVWTSEDKSIQIRKGLERADLLRDLGLIIVTHLNVCENQLKEDSVIFRNFEKDILNLEDVIKNNQKIVDNKDLEIETLNFQVNGQKKQKWAVVIIAATATYFAIFK